MCTVHGLYLHHPQLVSHLRQRHHSRQYPITTTIHLLQSNSDITSEKNTLLWEKMKWEYDNIYVPQFTETGAFLLRAAATGLLAGCSIVVFKTGIAYTQELLYVDLASVLPKPAPIYWPLAVFPLVGSVMVSVLTVVAGDRMKNGIDTIARSIDADAAEIHSSSTHDGDKEYDNDSVVFRDREHDNDNDNDNDSDPVVEELNNSTTITSMSAATSIFSTTSRFRPLDLLFRTSAAVATLGSGNSLGPEGSAVEIGAGISRIVGQFQFNRKRRPSTIEAVLDGPESPTGVAADVVTESSIGTTTSLREQHHLFLAGTAAGVAGGFNAPITGVFFAIEVGNRYLGRNTIKLDEESPDGPRADIAAIVLAAAVSNLVVSLGLHEKVALSIQGNTYAMESPVFELSVYMGLGLVSGLVSVIFNVMRDFFIELYAGKTWAKDLPFARIPPMFRPMLGGLSCGLTGVFFPQTLFVGYVMLDQLISGRSEFPTPLIMQLLALKLTLSSFCLGSGLVGGVFAPALFFGAAAGTAYHDFVVQFIQSTADFLSFLPEDIVNSSFWSVANAPAYATVGAAATLGALFRAPLTSSMLMFELTQNHDIVLPVLVSTGLGGLFAELILHPRRLD